MAVVAHDGATGMTPLGCVALVDLNVGLAVKACLVFKHSLKAGPARIRNRHCQGMILHQIFPSQVLKHYYVVVIDVCSAELLKEVLSLIANPSLKTRRLFAGLLIVFALPKFPAFLFSTILSS
jgi:hypothetical protein